MATKFEELYGFIDRAVRNRKYPSTTAQGLKVGLKIFESELNDEELASIDKVKENLDQIYHSVSTKNKNVAQSSLATYKLRLTRVVRDFEQYGADPTKMNTWSVKPVVRQPTRTKKSSIGESVRDEVTVPPVKPEFDTSLNFVFDFKGGIKLVVPRNQSTSDAVADGELKEARRKLTEFADRFMGEEIVTEDSAQADAL